MCELLNLVLDVVYISYPKVQWNNARNIVLSEMIWRIGRICIFNRTKRMLISDSYLLGNYRVFVYAMFSKLYPFSKVNRTINLTSTSTFFSFCSPTDNLRST